MSDALLLSGLILFVLGGATSKFFAYGGGALISPPREHASRLRELAQVPSWIASVGLLACAVGTQVPGATAAFSLGCLLLSAGLISPAGRRSAEIRSSRAPSGRRAEAQPPRSISARFVLMGSGYVAGAIGLLITVAGS